MSTYEAGPRRAYERSTAAHNTIEIDGESQTEVWGIFRAARRSRGNLELVTRVGSTVEVVASHNGYRQLPGSPVHRRRWQMSSGRVEIADTISGVGAHRVVSRLHVGPMATSLCSITESGGHSTTEPCSTACGFGVLQPATVHQVDATRADLPATLVWLIEWPIGRSPEGSP
jgi:hypothetical protein